MNFGMTFGHGSHLRYLAKFRSTFNHRVDLHFDDYLGRDIDVCSHHLGLGMKGLD